MNLKLIVIALTFVQLSASDWTNKDTLVETTYLAMHTADWLQTLKIRDPHCPLHEANPVLGRKPSRGKVNAYFLATGIAHILIAHSLPPKTRHWFQVVTIGMEVGCIGNNYSLGVRVKF